MFKQRINIEGQQFGKLSVLEYSHTSDGRAYWRCKCTCGKEKIAAGRALRIGKVKSCGCLVSEMTIAYNKIAIRGTHRDCSSKEYFTWQSINSRCYYPKNVGYKHYGGRGIKVCDRWRHSYESFLEDMGRAPGKKYSIDRIDTNGDYSPDNCRWATFKVQGNNRRNTTFLVVDGVRKSLAEWCDHLGVNRERTRYRLSAGYSAKAALGLTEQ